MGLVDAAYVRLRPHWAHPGWDGPLTEAQGARLRRHLLAFGMSEAQADFHVRRMHEYGEPEASAAPGSTISSP